MSVQVDIEGYAAEQRFKELRRMPQESLRAERKQKKRERLAILAKIEEYEAKLCDKCKDKPNSYKCECPASKAIQELGQQLGFEGEKVGRKREKPDEEFAAVVWKKLSLKDYESMKSKDMTDKDIWKKIGWNSQKLNDWKRGHGLVKGHKKHAPKPGRPKKGPSAKINGLTVDAYLTHKADSRSDAWISNKYGIPSSNLTRWKRANGVSASTKPQQAVQQPKGEKMMNDVVEVQEPLEVNYKAKYEAMKTQFESAAKDYSFLKTESLQYRARAEKAESENIILNADFNKLHELFAEKNRVIRVQEDEIEALKESLSQSVEPTVLQNEIYSLTTELNRLKKYEADYRNLEVEHRNLRSRFHALEEELEFHRETDRSQLLIMKQYLRLRERVDEVFA